MHNTNTTNDVGNGDQGLDECTTCDDNIGFPLARHDDSAADNDSTIKETIVAGRQHQDQSPVELPKHTSDDEHRHDIHHKTNSVLACNSALRDYHLVDDYTFDIQPHSDDAERDEAPASERVVDTARNQAADYDESGPG